MTSSEIIATALIGLSVLGWGVLRRTSTWIRLAAGAGLLALLTVAVIGMASSPLRPAFVAAGPVDRLWQQIHHLGVVAARRAPRGRSDEARASASRPPPRRAAVLDLLASLLYLVVLLTIVSTVFGLPIGGLVATSGVIAIVLGLALQNTLADVFAGIAVGIERPYAIGDQIWLDGPIEGEVTQINWRSVQIRTFGNDIATVPNSLVAKSRIINRSFPSPRGAPACNCRAMRRSSRSG